MLPSSYTGIRFENRLTDTNDSTSSPNRNYYNGGGVALGDLNGDGLPEIRLTSTWSEPPLPQRGPVSLPGYHPGRRSRREAILGHRSDVRRRERRWPARPYSATRERRGRAGATSLYHKGLNAKGELQFKEEAAAY